MKNKKKKCFPLGVAEPLKNLDKIHFQHVNGKCKTRLNILFHRGEGDKPSVTFLLVFICLS